MTPSRMNPVLRTTTHSDRPRGQGVRRSTITGNSTASAIAIRYTANAAGGTSRTPSLMNSQTVLQIAQVSTHTKRMNGVIRCCMWRLMVT